MYSNSYALVLLIAIYLNSIRESDIFTDHIETILIIGLLFTQSRTTLILLIVYFIFKVLNEIIIKKCSTKYLLSILLPAIIGLLQYIIYSNILMASIFIFPIFIYIYKPLKDLTIKLNSKSIYLVFLLIMVVFIFSSNDMIERIKDISFENGSLQEILIYFKDAISAIKSNPFGNGINMFKYKSYNTASAFYDVKYIHNSILQIFYDCGIITGTLFISILIYILFYILNHKHKNTLPLIILYITLITHSLMDFDFSFCSITILLMLIIILSKVFSNNEKEIIKKNYILSYKFKYYFYKFSLIFILFIAIYLSLFESAMSFGKYFHQTMNIKKVIAFIL